MFRPGGLMTATRLQNERVATLTVTRLLQVSAKVNDVQVHTVPLTPEFEVVVSQARESVAS